MSREARTRWLVGIAIVIPILAALSPWSPLPAVHTWWHDTDSLSAGVQDPEMAQPPVWPGVVNPPIAFANGRHAIGSDIEPGLYAVSPSASCSWVVQDDAGRTISDGVAPAIIELTHSAAWLTVTDCPGWVRARDSHPPVPATSFTDGTWQVDTHIATGIHRAMNPGPNCVWSTLAGFSGDETITTSTVPLVELTDDVPGFVSHDCGLWEALADTVATQPPDQVPDGAWIADTDLALTTWRAQADSDRCQWSLHADLGPDAELQTTGRGPGIVTLHRPDQLLVSEDCGVWHQLADLPAPPLRESVADGTWIVGKDIEPGTWTRDPDNDGHCVAMTVRDFEHRDESTLDFVFDERTIVVPAEAAGFATNDCGTWTRQR